MPDSREKPTEQVPENREPISHCLPRASVRRRDAS
jgi:hypothetical protein